MLKRFNILCIRFHFHTALINLFFIINMQLQNNYFQIQDICERYHTQTFLYFSTSKLEAVILYTFIHLEQYIIIELHYKSYYNVNFIIKLQY